MILVSAFLVFMQQGSIQIASQFGLNENASDIITGILLFFLFLSLSFLTFCIVSCKTKKDIQTSDSEQEKFIKEYKKEQKK